MGHGVVWCDAAIGFDLQAQSFASGSTLTNGGFIHRVVDPAHGLEHSIDLKKVDGVGVFAVAIDGPIANTTLHMYLHFEAVAFSHGGDQAI